MNSTACSRTSCGAGADAGRAGHVAIVGAHRPEAVDADQVAALERAIGIEGGDCARRLWLAGVARADHQVGREAARSEEDGEAAGDQVGLGQPIASIISFIHARQTARGITEAVALDRALDPRRRLEQVVGRDQVEPRVERRFDLAAVALEHRTLTVRASSAQTASGVTRWSNKWIVGPATGSTKAE